MSFHVETWYPGAGMFMPTNHSSENLESLTRLVEGDTFRGFRVRIVDEDGKVVFEPAFRERETDPRLSDISELLGAPIVQLSDFGIEVDPAESSREFEVQYTLQVIHEGTFATVASFALAEKHALEIIDRLWPGANLWAAPGGCSFHIADEKEVRTINEILPEVLPVFNKDKHRWLLHVHGG
jgi:hypothetical protein